MYSLSAAFCPCSRMITEHATGGTEVYMTIWCEHWVFHHPLPSPLWPPANILHLSHVTFKRALQRLPSSRGSWLSISSFCRSRDKQYLLNLLLWGLSPATLSYIKQVCEVWKWINPILFNWERSCMVIHFYIPLLARKTNYLSPIWRRAHKMKTAFHICNFPSCKKKVEVKKSPSTPL